MFPRNIISMKSEHLLIMGIQSSKNKSTKQSSGLRTRSIITKGGTIDTILQKHYRIQ